MYLKKSPVLVSYNIFRDPKSDWDLMKRFNLYGSYLSKLTRRGVSKLTIISTSNSDKITNKKNEFRYINFINPQVNFFRFFLYIRKYFKTNKSSISLIICGNPWLDFFIIKLASINLDLKVQVSIHGEPYLVTNFMKDFFSFLKNVWLKIFLRKADSVRLVSKHQIDLVLKKYKVIRSKIIIAPIPILIPTKITKTSEQKNTIIFLGRLHSERGLDLWLNIITGLHKIRKDFDLLIIGDGELRMKFEKYLSCIPNGPRYKFIGWIDQNNLPNYLAKGRVLLNTAPTESNGSAMREAQMLGLNIVSYANNGALSNLEFFGSGILIFRNQLEGISQLNKAIDKKPNFKTIQTFRKKQSRLNKQSLDTLARSWLGTKNT